MTRIEGNAVPSRNIKWRTAKSFGYEWRRFNVSPLKMEENFRGYFQFFPDEFFVGKRVLEAGCGMGRHTYFLAKYAKDVIAIDISDAIYVAADNSRGHKNAGFVVADVNDLPFADESFDFVCSIGVLHHLVDTEAAFEELLRCLRTGGVIHVYLYRSLEGDAGWKRFLLTLVTLFRRLTTRLPFPLLDKVAWLVALGGYFTFSLPYRYLRRWPRAKVFAETLPLKRYALDGFHVCYNDQFDRLSAPLEKRYTYPQVQALFDKAGLTNVRIEQHYGWIASGQKPKGWVKIERRGFGTKEEGEASCGGVPDRDAQQNE